MDGVYFKIPFTFLKKGRGQNVYLHTPALTKIQLLTPVLSSKVTGENVESGSAIICPNSSAEMAGAETIT